jgi:hypothetical protein
MKVMATNAEINKLAMAENASVDTSMNVSNNQNKKLLSLWANKQKI